MQTGSRVWVHTAALFFSDHYKPPLVIKEYHVTCSVYKTLFLPRVILADFTLSNARQFYSSMEAAFGVDRLGRAREESALHKRLQLL